MPASTVTIVLLIFLGGVCAATLLARLLSGRRAAPRKEPPRRFWGVKVRFGCGDVQRTCLYGKDGICIERSVHARRAAEHNCHSCWLRTGIDRIDAANTRP